MLWLLIFLFGVLLIFFLCFIIYRELKAQRDFEIHVAREWAAMTEEEKLASGRENMHC